MADELNPDENIENALVETGSGDVEMQGAGADDAPADNVEPSDLPFPEGDETESRVSFASYLSSPIVTLLVGVGETETILTSHQALLTQSPFFADACAAFVDDGSIELGHEDVEAVGFFLEFLYTGEYFPKKLPGQHVLELDPSVPSVDETGDQLLKHARVYTLAEKFVYARYVYTYTTKDDTSMCAPVANFWATRSHTLRSEAEDEFRALCLEYPEFGYDVLTRVLDEKVKRESQLKLQPTAASGGSGRKRPRHSNVG
ncbi:hypothetical protein BX600DRAFT_509016 [Xylariales sp. PMI_506]|nr:hypothetical protein BX600DRAFT_509016 [Xylariales sp. PMI_506]